MSASERFVGFIFLLLGCDTDNVPCSARLDSPGRGPTSALLYGLDV